MLLVGGSLKVSLGSCSRPWMLLGMRNFFCLLGEGGRGGYGRRSHDGMGPTLCRRVRAGRPRQVFSACGLAEGIVGAHLPRAGSLPRAQGCPTSPVCLSRRLAPYCQGAVQMVCRHLQEPQASTNLMCVLGIADGLQ